MRIPEVHPRTDWRTSTPWLAETIWDAKCVCGEGGGYGQNLNWTSPLCSPSVLLLGVGGGWEVNGDFMLSSVLITSKYPTLHPQN